MRQPHLGRYGTAGVQCDHLQQRRDDVRHRGRGRRRRHFLGGGAFYSNPPASLPAGYGALTVYGNTTGNVININNGGNADVGGTADAHINFNGGGTYIGAPPNIMADFQTSLNDLSQSLANFQATGVLPTSGNNVLINADPNASGMAAIDLTASGLATIPSFQINLADASSLIFRSRT